MAGNMGDGQTTTTTAAECSCNSRTFMCNAGPLQFKSNFLVTGGKHFLVVEVFNKSNRTIEIWDAHIVHISETKNLVNLECHPKIGLFSGKLIVLRPIEKYNLFIELAVASSNSLLYPKRLHLHLVTEWRFDDNTLKQNTTIHHLPKLSVRQPSFLLAPASYSPSYVGEKFLVNYTVVNNLQDFIVELQWNPDKAKTTTAEGNTTVVCHNPGTTLRYFKQGSSITVGITFTVFQEGIVELSEAMKVTLHYLDDMEQNGAMTKGPMRWSITEPAQVPPLICEDDSEDEEDDDHMTTDTANQRKVTSQRSDPENRRVRAVSLTMQRLLGQPCQVYVFGAERQQMKLL